MEVSPVSASLGAIVSLPRKLDELVATRDWALRGTVMDEIEQLTADLCILYKLMLKLSDAPQEPPIAARYWLKEVRELSYDMDDFADQFLHAHARAKIRRAARRRIISRVKIKRLPERRKWRPWIIDKVSEFMTRAQEATRRYKFDACASNAGYPRSGRELPAIFPDPGDLVGIQGPSDKLQGWLITREEQLKVVSIVGVGGIGKTTLALKLWGKLRGQFECGAFVRTARKPDMRGILRNILLQIRPHQPPNHGEMHHLIDDLREYLQDKRYFVIIDDLWATSVWDVVSRAFPRSDCFSRIVTTTEIMEVALACCCFCPGHIFKMEPLSDIDSEKLLLQRILVSRNQSPQQFDDVIPQIMRSCGGLPLAIIIVARILASQPEKLDQWGSTQNSFDYILGANPTMEEFMGPIFNICFISLPYYLKTCLLHLSIYPEGYLFFKDDLVKQWVAEDFICANEGEDLEEVAGSYFDELVSMGLIQVMDINGDFESLSYSVHQLVLDLIAYKSIEENFITVVDYSQTTIPLADKVRRLSLHFGSATYATTPACTGLSQVRSLFFSGLFNCMPSIAVFKLLRVLILHLWDDTGTKTLNLTGICELFWLKYLQVTYNVTVKLPDKIQAMKHLETLEINAQVLDIPLDIARLSSLLHLCLRGANLPSGIGHIRSLRTLMHFDLGNSSEENLCGLGELKNLQDLYLTYSSSLSSEHLKRNLIALACSLGKLCNLKSFSLVPGTAGMVVLFDGSSDMSTPIFLERLELLPPICIFSKLPKWTGQLRKICIMKVAVRELPTSDIAILTGLPSLTVLSLSVQTAPEERLVFNDRAFPVLKCFKFRCGVLCMSFMAGAMPNLRGLKLCFNVHIGEEYGNMLVGIEHLLNLQDIVVQIGATTESDSRAAESAINYTINKHPRFLRLNLQLVDPVEEERRPLKKHHWSQEKGSLGEHHEVLEKANEMNKHADSGLSQLPNQPSTVASGRLKSDSPVEESKESAAPALPCKKTRLDGNILNDVPARENRLGLLKNLDDDSPCLLDIVRNDKMFNITDFSPEWACSTEHTKILVVGCYYEQYKHLAGSNIYGIFGDICVVANMIQTGVYRFMVGPHTPGQVDFYLTLDGKTPISEVLSFEYRSMPGSSLQSELKPAEDEYIKSKLQMQMRLSRLLFVTNKKEISPNLLVGSSKVSNLILASLEKEWMDLWKIAGDPEGTPIPATEDLLELVLRNRLQEWLLERVTRGHKSTGRDDLGQGPIHMCSFLGYTWAIHLLSVAGFSLDFRDSSGWTALHWAAYHGREKMVSALLSAGANPSLVTDPTATSPGGCTPADLAARQGYVGLAEYLAEKGLAAHFESVPLSKDTERSPSKTNRTEVQSEKSVNLTEQELCLKESLAAYRRAADAAINIQAAVRDRAFKLQTKTVILGSPDFSATAIIAAMRIQHAFRNYKIMKEMRAVARIQNHFRAWKVRKNFTNMRRQAITIQSAYRGHQVRRQNRKVIWSVGVVEKAILRWRKKRKAAEEDFIQASRQRAEDKLHRSVAHVEALFRGYRVQHEYRRMRIAHEEAMLELSKEQQRGPACRSHELNIYMSASRHDLNVQYT